MAVTSRTGVACDISIERNTDMNRRQCIAGLVVSPVLFSDARSYPAPEKLSVVYEAFDERMVDGSKAVTSKVDENVVIAAVNSLIKKISGKKSLDKAWQTLLPGITLRSKIAIKLNLLHPYNSPQFATLKAVVLGLQAMFKAHSPPNTYLPTTTHIIIRGTESMRRMIPTI